jgi:hypothetical protein
MKEKKDGNNHKRKRDKSQANPSGSANTMNPLEKIRKGTSKPTTEREKTPQQKGQSTDVQQATSAQKDDRHANSASRDDLQATSASTSTRQEDTRESGAGALELSSSSTPRQLSNKTRVPHKRKSLLDDAEDSDSDNDFESEEESAILSEAVRNLPNADPFPSHSVHSSQKAECPEQERRLIRLQADQMKKWTQHKTTQRERKEEERLSKEHIAALIIEEEGAPDSARKLRPKRKPSKADFRFAPDKNTGGYQEETQKGYFFFRAHRRSRGKQLPQRNH